MRGIIKSTISRSIFWALNSAIASRPFTASITAKLRPQIPRHKFAQSLLVIGNKDGGRAHF